MTQTNHLPDDILNLRTVFKGETRDVAAPDNNVILGEGDHPLASVRQVFTGNLPAQRVFGPNGVILEPWPSHMPAWMRGYRGS